MNKLDLYKIIDLIDEDLVREAADDIEKPKSEYGDYQSSVSGVDVYHAPHWKKYSALAAAVVLAVGAGIGGFYLMKNRPAIGPAEFGIEPTAEVKDAPAVPENTTEITSKESSEKQQSASPEPPQTTSALDSGYVITETEPVVADVPVETGESPTQEVRLPQYAEVTTPEGVPVPVTTTTEPAPNDTPYVPEDSQYVYDSLASLTYCPETCDGIPEYTLFAPDGTIYYISFTGGWVWRNGNEEAILPAEVALAIQTQMNRKYGNDDPIAANPYYVHNN